MDAPEPRLWTGAPERQIGVDDNPSTWMPRAALSSADPPKVVPSAQQPSFVRDGPLSARSCGEALDQMNDDDRLM
jgi:hypothetical protein